MAERLPPFFELAAHPVRWRLLTELASSDRRVGELCDLTDRPQSLVSYHLRRLRDGGLVAARRSGADRRDSYYVLDLAGCERRLRGAATALHPGLARPRTEPSSRIADVLFLCTGNSGRSPMAAALIEQLSDGSVHAASAGSHPKPLQAGAVAALRRRGLEIGAHRPTHVDRFAGRRFDRVITLCDRVREVCPEFPGSPTIHWSIPDPAREDGPTFAQTAEELETRIHFLLASLNPPEEHRVHA